MPGQDPFYMNNEAVRVEVDRRGELGFQALPHWLRQEVKTRELMWQPRPPTDFEQFETYTDAIAQRIGNNEMTIKDHINMFKGMYSHVQTCRRPS